MEENKTEDAEEKEDTDTENVEEEVEDTKPEMPEDEKKARNDGWVSEDEFNKLHGDDPNMRFRPIHEFNDRGEFFAKYKTQNNKIKSQERELTQIRDDMDVMKHGFGAARQAEYNRAYRELTAERNDAIKEGETEKAGVIDQNIEQITADHFSSAPPQPTQTDPDYVAWVNENDWFRNDTALQAFAMAYAQNQSPTSELRGRAFYDGVTEAVKRAYPDKFEETQKREPAMVGRAKSGASNDNGTTRSDLPPEYKEVYDYYTKERKMDGKVLIKQWQDMGAF